MKNIKIWLVRRVSFDLCFLSLCFLSPVFPAFAWEKIVTVPAEDPQGEVIFLPAGTYIAEIAGGAVRLFLPIHPDYQWLYGLAIGTGVQGGQDEPNIGTLYFTPEEKVYTQIGAEKQSLAATDRKEPGTFLRFTLGQGKQVRFWVSDFDYSDNSGLERVRVRSE